MAKHCPPSPKWPNSRARSSAERSRPTS
ncbi:MAG: EspF repeat-containing protein [Agrobacterium tumefaciens]